MAVSKYKSVYFCNSCGYESPKWLGKCPGCGEWNTMVEQKVSVKPAAKRKGSLIESTSSPIHIDEIEAESQPRIKLTSGELNRVLGGGRVPGSLTLLGGEPGIGKSTLLLQNILSMRKRKVLYISGEESATQLKLRADRIGRPGSDVHVLCETDLDSIFTHISNINPDLIIVYSIQTMQSVDVESAPGSVTQVRECAAAFLRFAKQSGVPVMLVGHINKEGSIAGPKVLEHIVDTVLQFEGDRQYLYRIVRAIKNRFGSTSEIGIYEMVSQGLREVKNPSEVLLSQNRDETMSGTSIGVTIEGVRPFFVEVQALVSTAAYGTPQRSVTGFDQRRLNMLLAVLEKRAKFKLGQKDVFLNIAGGMKVADPALDLAVVAAVMSSNFDIAIPGDIAFAGEVGLSGEIRSVTRIDQRVAEAGKLGFHRIFVPRGSMKGHIIPEGIKVHECPRIEDMLREIFS